MRALVEAPSVARILTVDDDPDLGALMALMIKRLCYTVARVATRREALVRVHPVDMALLDLVMPEMDGMECCRRVGTEALLRDLPIIVISGSEAGAELVHKSRWSKRVCTEAV